MHSPNPNIVPPSSLTVDFSAVDPSLHRQGRPHLRKRYLPALWTLGLLLLGTVAANADDHGDTLSTATAVSVPSTTAGAIQFAGDRDCFRFTLTSAQNVTACSTGSTDTFGELMDSGGNVLSSNDDANGSRNFLITRQLNGGIYYVRVRHYSAGANTGDYQLVLSATTPPPPPITDDHGNTIASATAVNMPSTTSGAIQYAGDYDCFRFMITSTRNITACSTGSTDTFGDLMDSGGNVLASNDDANGSTNFSITRQLNSGSYYVRVRHYSAGVNNGAYQLVLSATSPPVTDDHGNTITSATSVSVPSTTNGAIQFAGDYDCFRFSLPGNRLITARTTGSTDTFGDLLDSAGNVLVSNDDANGSINFCIARVLNAGTYYVRVRHYDSAATSGTYQLILLSTNPAPEIVIKGNGAVIRHLGTVPLGTTQYWGDSLECEFVIQNPGTGTLVLTNSPPASLSSGAFSDRFSILTQPQSTIAPGGSTSFRVRYIQMGPGYASGQGPGLRTDSVILSIPNNTLYTDSDYRCTITASNARLPDDGCNTIATTVDMGNIDRYANGFGVGSGGGIDYVGDIDMVRFTVLASSLEVEVHTEGTTDTFGTLHNSTGALIASDDNSGGGVLAKIRMTLSAGTYYFGISGKPGGNVTGAYGFWIGRPR